MGYLKRVKIVGVRWDGDMGPYLPCVAIMGLEDAEGNSMNPKPDPPGTPLAVQDPTTTEGEVTLGSELVGTRATFTGGEEPIDIESRWERSDDSLTWVGLTGWQEVPVLTYTTVAQDNGKYIRFNTKAVDAEGTRVESEGDAIGPMVAAPIEVVTATKISNPIEVVTATKISNGTFVNPTFVYDFETITPISAIYSGGFGPLELRYRLQENTGGGWVSVGGWSGGAPSYDVSQSDVGAQLRWQTRATDEVGQTKISNSPATQVGVATTIGTLSIAPPATTADPNDVITFDAIISGDATPLYIWEIRSGPGTITSPSNIGDQITVAVNGGASSGESIQVQVTAQDQSSSDSPKGSLSTIVVN